MHIICKPLNKGDIMDVSSSSGSGSSSIQVDVMKKSTEVQERQVLKILEGATEQSQKVAAEKTGLGTKLNISA